jgi:hypothetical protein
LTTGDSLLGRSAAYTSFGSRTGGIPGSPWSGPLTGFRTGFTEAGTAALVPRASSAPSLDPEPQAARATNAAPAIRTLFTRWRFMGVGGIS